MGRNFRSIKAWQLADDLVIAIYDATATFPAEERYGLISQIRRAAVSTAANIAEGATRHSHKEYVQFLSIAKGSLAEVEYYLHLSQRLGYLTETQHRQLTEVQGQCGKTLHGLFKAVRNDREAEVVVVGSSDLGLES